MRFWMALSTLLALVSPAQAWPERPIQIIVPFPPGGVADVAARSLAQVLSGRIGTSVVVVNRDGASGAIGARAIATARPDGHTLGFLPSGVLTIQPHVQRDIAYGLSSFRPICQLFVGYFVLVGGQGGPADAHSAIAAARAAPGTVATGFGGNATAPHFAALGLQRRAGVEFNAVPFRGDPPLATALLGGELQLGVLTLGSIGSIVGRLPILLAFTQERITDLPDVPTARELGWPVVEEQFGGLIAPAGLPEPVAQRLEAECAAAAESPSLTETLRSARYGRQYRDGASFAAALAADTEAKRGQVAAAGLRPD